MGLIYPNWPAPVQVQACFTTREGGESLGVFAGLNLGAHVADDPAAVAANRYQLRESLHLSREPVWLNQVHGTAVYPVDTELAAQPATPPTADAAVTRLTDVALTVMTADCLPVLFCDRAGTVVATAHAGWRGLCDGVLEQTVAAMKVPSQEILAWLGPAIGATAFEVGAEVRAHFMQQDPAAASAFVPSTLSAPEADKWLGDLFLLARQRLARVGVLQVYGGQQCTFSDPQQFYSYRRDGQTGRMSGLIWLMAQN
jgi:YfiH family protein